MEERTRHRPTRIGTHVREGLGISRRNQDHSWMTIDTSVDEVEVDTTARIEIHPGCGTDSSISVSLCTNGQSFGTLTLGDSLIHWTAPDASAISFSPQELSELFRLQLRIRHEK
jgi:hypothetical protein